MFGTNLEDDKAGARTASEGKRVREVGTRRWECAAERSAARAVQPIGRRKTLDLRDFLSAKIIVSAQMTHWDGLRQYYAGNSSSIAFLWMFSDNARGLQPSEGAIRGCGTAGFSRS